jgi:hypothetical protein
MDKLFYGPFTRFNRRRPRSDLNQKISSRRFFRSSQDSHREHLDLGPVVLVFVLRDILLTGCVLIAMMQFAASLVAGPLPILVLMIECGPDEFLLLLIMILLILRL